MKRLRTLGYYSKQNGFFIVLGLILALGAGFGLYTRNQRKNAPQRSLEALHSSVSEVVLAASALQAIDGSSDTSPYSIDTTQASLKSALDTSQKLLNEHRNSLKDNYQPLKDALDEQSKTFEDFQAAYKVLGKAIYYNPSLDLGGLNTNTQMGDLGKRAKDASDNLNKLAVSYKESFSEETYNNLVKTVSCFGELADVASGSADGNRDTLRNRCINTYPTTRKHLVIELMKPFLGNKSKQSLSVLQSEITDIPRASK